MTETNPNVVPVTTGSNGSVKPNNIPAAPTNTNSSPLYQHPGSSLNKYVQGIITDTNIYIANSSLSHACDVTIDGKYRIFGITIEAKSLIEKARATEVGQWLASAAAPIIEAIKNVLGAVKFVLDQVKKVQKIIKAVMDEVSQLISAIKSLIGFIMGLPARLLAFAQACLDTAKQFLAKTISLTSDSVKSGLKVITDSANTATDSVNTITQSA